MRSACTSACGTDKSHQGLIKIADIFQLPKQAICGRKRGRKMPSNIYNVGENLHRCLSKLKRSTGGNMKKISPSSSSFSATTTCSITTQLIKPPPPPHHHKTERAAGLCINKYFNSLYHPSDDDGGGGGDPSFQAPVADPSPPHLHIHYSTNYISSSPNSSSSFSSSSEQQHDPVAAAAALASDGRFFFSSPGKSKSLVDDEATSVVFRDDGSGGKNSGLFVFAAVPTYSSDPCAEFRRSMEEMVAARGFMDDAAGGAVSLYLWDYLHGLLLCYLALNRRNTHKFILEAFNHLLLSLSPPHATA